MALTRSTFALVLLLFVSACSTAGPGPLPEPAPAPEPVTLYPDEDVEEGSAALEEAGLSGEDEGEGAIGARVDSSAPQLKLDAAADLGPPGSFLYPASGELPEGIQREVEGFVEKLTEGNARSNLEKWLEREAEWGDWVRSELRAAELPEELVYLAMIESGFHPTIVSHAGATGMWQFMPATARLSGLRVDSWVDERRDPEKATAAAIRHLSELYGETGDWALSAAAYNAGLGRVTRAQARAEADRRDYFSLTLDGRLPRETRNYVPIMLAAAWVDRHRSDFGLPERVVRERPQVDSLAVDGRTRLSVVAEGLGLDHDELKSLNPRLVRGAVPPEGAMVRVPVQTDTAGLGVYLAGLDRDQRLLPDWIETTYSVRSGDSWWAIARRHDTSVDRLRRLNPRRGDIIHPGDRLVVRRVASYDTGRGVPAREAVARDAVARTAAVDPTPTPTPAPVPVEESTTRTRASARPAEARMATPRSAEAGSASEARSAEKESSGRTAAPPASTPPSPVRTDYVVRPGDTMTGVARRLGVSVEQLAAWNGMSDPRPLRAGERLRVAPPVIEYIVQPGDTMTGIALLYQVSVEDLAEWNSMANPRPLRAGEMLVVRPE
jgi:membrane-bound lytic murein transglycosylase D